MTLQRGIGGVDVRPKSQGLDSVGVLEVMSVWLEPRVAEWLAVVRKQVCVCILSPVLAPLDSMGVS